MMMNFSSSGITSFIWSLMMIISMALPVLIGIWIALSLGQWFKDKKMDSNKTPLAALKTRLAKGEISIDDFQRLREQLS